jgi:uncharacterized protein DUF559
VDAALRKLAASQEDLVAVWQLAPLGWSWEMVRHRARAHGWRRIHRGVYALTQAPLTRRQLWIAATLTAPDTFLAYSSGGACWGFRPYTATFETVLRHGRGGPRRHGNILVCRSSVLAGDTTRHEGIPITTAARTLLDLAPHIGEKATGRAFREAIRLKATTAHAIEEAVARHHHRAGASLLDALATRYATLPYGHTRSDAECRGLEVLHDAGVHGHQVNVKVAGEEADFVWLDRRLIIELDGPQFHRFAEEDARKERAWTGAGFAVRRLPTEDVYERSDRLVTLARQG